MGRLSSATSLSGFDARFRSLEQAAPGRQRGEDGHDTILAEISFINPVGVGAGPADGVRLRSARARGDRDPAPVTVRRSAATAGPRTSPFEPEKESDRHFVTDAGNKLDTGCIYRSSGPIEFDIDVTRTLGPLKADGTLANADELIAAGVLGPTATLTMPGYDVDSGASARPTCSRSETGSSSTARTSASSPA